MPGSAIFQYQRFWLITTETINSVVQVAYTLFVCSAATLIIPFHRPMHVKQLEQRKGIGNSLFVPVWKALDFAKRCIKGQMTDITWRTTIVGRQTERVD